MTTSRLKPAHRRKLVWMVLSGGGVPMYGFMEATQRLAARRATEALGPAGKHLCPCGCGAIFGDYAIVQGELRWVDPWNRSIGVSVAESGEEGK